LIYSFAEKGENGGLIAVVGMACRLPRAVDPGEFWALLRDGVDTIGEPPEARRADASVPRGGFLDRVDEFDAEFFGISPREAAELDPQQRLMLELNWEALEDAGITPTALADGRTGVFLGVAADDYAVLAGQRGRDAVTAHSLTGLHRSMVANRVSYVLGLRGPSLTVDAGQSSSLVSVHLACESLRAGESDVAFAGGVSLNLAPIGTDRVAKFGALSPDSRCFTFDARANGYVRGEGGGVLLLKPLTKAVEDGDRVYCVIKGSAIGNDGGGKTLTTPDQQAQQEVLSLACDRAGVDPASVQYVELHGTGTRVGDPIEAAALGAVLGRAPGRTRPLIVGSAKTNVGHLEGAAGITGLLKVALSIRRRALPASLNFETPNPEIPLDELNLRLPRSTEEWPDPTEPLLAGVSSFGMGGTNCHVVVSEWSGDERRPGTESSVSDTDTPVTPLVVTARTREALSAQAARLAEHLETRRESLRDVGYSLVTTRAEMEHRAVVLASDRPSAVDSLRALACGVAEPGVVEGTTPEALPSSVVFVFPGQGSQWAGMAAGLLESSPVFAARLAECDAALAPLVDFSVADLLRGGDRLERVEVVQAALWAVMVSLAEVWRSHGVVPAAVVGHSQGEIAAACVAGALSLTDAAWIVVTRARAIARDLSGRGGMVSVALTAEAAEDRIAAYGAKIAVASLNGPSSTVIAGETEALDAVVRDCEADGIRARWIDVDYASHTPQVESISGDLAEAMAGVTAVEAAVPFYSTVTGERFDTVGLDADYWCTNLRRTVRFEPAVRRLLAAGHRRFVEVSPHPVLLPALTDAAEEAGADIAAVATLQRDRGDLRQMLGALAQAHTRGLPVDWRGRFAGARRVDLPTYPFQGRSFKPLGGARRPDMLFHMDWVPAPQGGGNADWAVLGDDESALLPALRAAGAYPRQYSDLSALRAAVDAGASTPELVVHTPPTDGDDALAATARLLAVVQDWLADERFGGSRLVVFTGRAVEARPGEGVDDLAGAALWGLIRSAQEAQPGRFLLVDLDADADSAAAAAEAVPAAVRAGEPQLAIRGGGSLMPRLAPVSRAPAPRWDTEGTVLITGGTGLIGGQVARHLAAEHGVRHLVLLSRRGEAAEGASELAADLARLGASVTIEACDAADRSALAAVIDRVPDDRRLTGVVHAAGALADTALGSLTRQDLEAVFAAKVDAALHLHELAGDVSAFVLFSSVSGTLGGAGQANYAAANVFLDALAAQRRSRGLPAVSMAWGLWGDVSGLTGTLDAEGRRRLARRGFRPMSTETGLALFDAALGAEHAASVPVQWDHAALREQAEAGLLPAVLRDLVTAREPVSDGAPVPASPTADRFAALPEAEREGALLDLVRHHTAVVLGRATGDTVAVSRPFTEFGIDSLTAIELRNRLNAATGLRLPAALVFDEPTPAAVARYVHAELFGARAEETVASPATVTEDDPVVIIGAGCRFPGEAGSLEQLWDLMAEGRDAIGPFPLDRGWDVEGLFDPVPGTPGKSYVREGGFLYEAAEFDPEFFGISPREAVAMDPQQRLLLEVAWEGVERAGIDPLSLRGSATGVFIGSGHGGYGGEWSSDDSDGGGYRLTGTTASVTSGRVAYTLGLEGPAITVDTACSSSLVALHWAVSALRAGECSLALAGGVTVISTPERFVEFSRQRGLAPDGRVKAFAGAADGTAWGEGAGIVVLERLSDARRNGHRVLGVVRGTALNQDGASNGLTAPSGTSQRRVIRAALADAGLAADEVDAVETHGTGTTLGDPIEAQALLATYGRDRREPLWIGSLKSNIGHTQATAGIAGIIKMLLALRHETLPRTLHVDTPTPNVDWSAGNVRLLTEPVDWPRGGRPRRAGVSAFGISGTNAHVIVEEAPVEAPQDGPGEEPGRSVDGAPEPAAVPWVLSAATPEGVRAQARRLADHLAERSDGPVEVGYSLATTRAALAHRASLPVTDTRDGIDRLRALAGGEAVPGAAEGEARDGAPTAVLFAGQGTQRPGMGRGLYKRFPAFADALDEACGHLDGELGFSLREAMFADDAVRLRRTGLAQPALFALEVALFRLLESWGITPGLLLGHSIGELAAAHVAGVFSLPDACRLVAARGRLMQELPEGGAMVAVRAPEEEIVRSIEGRAGVGIAAVNGPTSVVLSGDTDAVDAIAGQWRARGYKTARLNVSHAFHSHRMDPMLNGFHSVARSLAYHPPRIPLVSNVTGLPVTDEVCSPQYWVDQVRQAVRFADGVRALRDHGVRRYVEAGPDGTLSAMAAETLGRDATTVPLLRKNRDEEQSVCTAVGRLHVDGTEIDWRRFFPATEWVELPTSAFQRTRHWLRNEPRPKPTDAHGWRYRVDWRRGDVGPVGALSGTWLVVASEEVEETAAVVEALTGRGARVVSCVPPSFEREALAKWFPGSAFGGVSGVVSLVGGDVEAVLSVVQALGDAGIDAPLWCVTRGGVSAGGAVDPVQARVWGLGRVAALEHPDRWGGLVDLPEVVDERALGLLCAVVAGGHGEDQIAVRDAGVLVRRLVPAAGGGSGAGERWRPRGTVLVTGGTGGLGAHVARWAAREGADHLLLISRRGPAAPGADRLARELEESGAEVTITACDVADREALTDVLAAVPRKHPLTAVVHAAGIPDGGTLADMTPADLAASTAAKADGARHLDALTEDADLDAFVLFSSVAGVWGSAGQGAYAAANHYLDAFAEQRRARGLPATAVAWGPWDGDGMAADAEVRERMRQLGLPVMAPESAIAELRLAVDRGDTSVVVADVGWERFERVFTMSRPSPLLEHVAVAGPAHRSPAVATEPVLRKRLSGLPDIEHTRVLLDAVRSAVAAVLGHASPADVAEDRSFSDAGFDSLTAVELRDRLDRDTGLSLPATLVFDHPTPEALAEHLRVELDVGGTSVSLLAGLDRLEESMTASVTDESTRELAEKRLRILLRKVRERAVPDRTVDADEEVALSAASDEDMFDLLGKEFGIS
jgi:8,8a-deoxyoleandolide synthase